MVKRSAPAIGAAPCRLRQVKRKTSSCASAQTAKATAPSPSRSPRGTGSTPGPSDSPLYPVQISEKPEHGSILISPTAAAKDTIVTLTVSPDAGYTLDALSVTADAGRRIEIRAEGNGRYNLQHARRRRQP